MTKYLFMAGFLLSAAFSYAQHTVSGIVSRKDDPTQLISDVQVYLLVPDRFDITKEGGTYILRDIPVGTYIIQFSKPGYRTVCELVNTEDSAKVINMELEPSSWNPREASLLSAAYMSDKEFPLASVQASDFMLNRYGVAHPMAALALLPGVDRITGGQGIQRPVIRGASGNQVLNYQFGARQLSATWDDRQDLEINTLGLDRAEVVKGPASLMYGPGASGGVILWKDEPPVLFGNIEGRLDLGYYTNSAGADASLAVRGASESGWTYGVYLGGKSHTSYVQGDTGTYVRNTEDKDFALNSRYSTYAGKVVLGHNSSWGSSKLTLSHLQQSFGAVNALQDAAYYEPGQLTIDERKRAPVAPYRNASSQVISWENSLPYRQGVLQSTVSYQQSMHEDQDSVNQSVENVQALRMSGITYDAHYTSNPWSRSGWTAGIQGVYANRMNSGLVAVVPNHRMVDAGAYLLGRFNLKKVDVLTGLRFDLRSLSMTYTPLDDSSRNLSYQGLSANGGIVWHAAGSLDVNVNVSSGWTAPDPYQLAASGQRRGYHIENGNPDLKPEAALQADLGLTYRTSLLTVQAQAFSRQMNSCIYLKPTGATEDQTVAGNDTLLSVYAYDQAKAQVQGGEFMLSVHPPSVRWLEWTLGYAKTTNSLSGDDESNLALQPADKLVTSLRIQAEKFSGMKNAFALLTWSSFSPQSSVASYERPFDSYSLLDVSFGGSMRWGEQYFDVTLAATNVLNSGYIQPLTTLYDQPIREIGRNIMIRFRFPIGFSSAKAPAVGS